MIVDHGESFLSFSRRGELGGSGVSALSPELFTATRNEDRRAWSARADWELFLAFPSECPRSQLDGN